MEQNIPPQATLILGIVGVVAGAIWYSFERWVLKVDMFRLFGELIFFFSMVIVVQSTQQIFFPEFPVLVWGVLKDTATRFGR